MSTGVREITFPAEWINAGTVAVDVFDPMTIEDEKNGAQCVVTGVLMNDGNNLWAVAWPHGARLARVYGLEGTIEERHQGHLNRRHEKVVGIAWRVVKKSMITAVEETRGELDEPLCKACGAQIDLDGEIYCTIDFELHCARCHVQQLARGDLVAMPPAPDTTRPHYRREDRSN